ncbi:hypothetical protein GQ42DRAFT_17347 [Ramicandelaber brevisporus]|nr:hypothetical protein GQ42DRAFT_17347 [Ramicandelaber brevisporus]
MVYSDPWASDDEETASTSNAQVSLASSSASPPPQPVAPNWDSSDDDSGNDGFSTPPSGAHDAAPSLSESIGAKSAQHRESSTNDWTGWGDSDANSAVNTSDLPSQGRSVSNPWDGTQSVVKSEDAATDEVKVEDAPPQESADIVTESIAEEEQQTDDADSDADDAGAESKADASGKADIESDGDDDKAAGENEEEAAGGNDNDEDDDFDDDFDDFAFAAPAEPATTKPTSEDKDAANNASVSKEAPPAPPAPSEDNDSSSKQMTYLGAPTIDANALLKQLHDIIDKVCPHIESASDETKAESSPADSLQTWIRKEQSRPLKLSHSHHPYHHHQQQQQQHGNYSQLYPSHLELMTQSLGLRRRDEHPSRAQLSGSTKEVLSRALSSAPSSAEAYVKIVNTILNKNGASPGRLMSSSSNRHNHHPIAV